MVNSEWRMVDGARQSQASMSNGALPKAQRQFTIDRSLFTLKNRFALLDVGAQSLAGVFGLEELLLEFAFECEAVLEGDFGAGLDAALDAADGERGLVGGGELSCVGEHLFHERLARVGDEEAVDEAELARHLE